MSTPPVERRDIAGLATGVCVVGDGSPVLALHGWGRTLHDFWPVAERLAPEGYQVHLLDLPGFGRSALPPATWDVADYMRHVLAYMDAAGLERVALLGHSFGGRIGLMLAAEHVDRVRKMVLADAAGIRAPLGFKQQVRNLLARTTRRTLELAGMDGMRDRMQERYNQRYASADYLNAGPLRETFVAVIQQDLSPFAAHVKAPTVLIWGDQDQDTPLWQGRRLEQLIPDAGLIVFEGAGHFAFMERLNDYMRIVTHFLNNEG